MENNYEEYASVFKALSDVTRLKIVKMLESGEMCACKILDGFHITQPTLSYHMKILTECGLVTGVRNGAWMRYTLNYEKLEQIKAFGTHLGKENFILRAT